MLANAGLHFSPKELGKLRDHLNPVQNQSKKLRRGLGRLFLWKDAPEVGKKVAGDIISRDQLAEVFMTRGDSARGQRNYIDAGILYAEALKIAPDRAAVHIQAGHMFKEAGDLARAEKHYLAAERLTPLDADLTLQLGHFYKVGGRLKEAEAAYKRALEIKPGWVDPARELAFLRAKGWVGGNFAMAVVLSDQQESAVDDPSLPVITDEDALRLSSAADGLVLEIVPRAREELLYEHHDGILLHRLGRQEPSRWGMISTLRGVDAIRGFYNFSVPLIELQIFLNDLLVHRAPLKGGYKLEYNKDNETIRKYVFNAWCDFSPFVRGRYDLELRFIDINGLAHSHQKKVAVAEPLAETDYPNSDSVLTLAESDTRSVERQINDRPSIVRAAKREPYFSKPIRNVLVLRTDQLGDLVTSVPALRRLRELFPDANLVGLVTPANAALAITLGLFDEVITINFPDDRFQKSRVMPFTDQQKLQKRLKTYNFDLAMDLAEARTSRPLLRLSGAKYLYGFYDRDFPWLSMALEANTHDPRNEREVAPQSTRVMALIERLGSVLESKAEIVRRTDLARERLAAYGLVASERFAVFHTGSRIEVVQWPNFYELASRVLAVTDLKLFIMTEDSVLRERLPSDLTANSRFQLLDRRLPFDDFDAFLSYCDVFVGNDSGPKHLASLRGTHVISLHTPRVNWSEWGQEMAGSIISRKVPCAGCQIVYNYEECGQDIACLRNITVDEVFAEVMKVVGS